MDSSRTRVAFAAVMIATLAALAGCEPLADTATPATVTPAAEQSSPTPAPQAGVEVALAAIDWPTGPVVARVNGVEIPTEVWREEVTRQLRLVTSYYQVDWSDQANLARLPAFLAGELDRMITMELLRQAAAKEGVSVTDADAQQEVESARQEILAAGQYKTFDEFMQANELTQQKFDAMIRDQVLAERMMTAHGGPTEVEQVHARRIVVADEQKAAEVQQKLADGEPFAELAKTYSTDAGNREQGGDLGWLPQGVMGQDFDQVAFALQAGETSDPVKAESGYYILRVEERAVRPLEEPILSQVRQQAFGEWLESQRQAANIETFYQAPPQPT